MESTNLDSPGDVHSDRPMSKSSTSGNDNACLQVSNDGHQLQEESTTSTRVQVEDDARQDGDEDIALIKLTRTDHGKNKTSANGSDDEPNAPADLTAPNQDEDWTDTDDTDDEHITRMDPVMPGPARNDNAKEERGVLAEQDETQEICDPDPFGSTTLFSPDGRPLQATGDFMFEDITGLPLQPDGFTVLDGVMLPPHIREILSVTEDIAENGEDDDDGGDDDDESSFISISTADSDDRRSTHPRVPFISRASADDLQNDTVAANSATYNGEGRSGFTAATDDVITGEHGGRIFQIFDKTDLPTISMRGRSRPMISKPIGKRRELEARNFLLPRSRASKMPTKSIQELTWSQLVRNQARFHTFKKVQMIKLYRNQHDLARRLEKFFNKNKIRENAETIIDLRVKAFGTYRWKQIEDDITTYIQALRDLHWTKSLSRLSWADSKSHTQQLLNRFEDAAYTSPLVFDMNPYVGLTPPRTSADLIRKLLAKILPPILTAPDRTQHAWEYKRMGVSSSKLRPIPSTQTLAVDFLARFVLALLTGAMLMAPIIAMSFVSSQNLRLVVSSVFVIAFSVVLSFATNATNQEVIGGSAAYAAIIVVFVGSALSSSG